MAQIKQSFKEQTLWLTNTYLAYNQNQYAASH